MRAILTTHGHLASIATLFAVLVMLGTVLPGQAQQAPESAVATAPDPVLARVDQTALTQGQVRQMLLAEMRKRFYHGRIPRDQAELFVVEMIQESIDRVLLVDEARRRGIQPAAAEVAERLARIEARYAADPAWTAQRDQAVPQIRRQLEEISLREQLETAVKTAPVATPDKLHDYYAAHPDKFTEPERLRASIILLGVDPSSTRETWQMAQQRAAELHAELLAGADFAELARRHSTDPTAENGGDMGYLHQGMLAENVHAALQSLAPGGLTPPLRVLEGVAVLRLDERHPARHLPYPEVQARVAALWADDAGLQAWQALLERLRGAAEIVIDEAAMASLREELIALLN